MWGNWEIRTDNTVTSDILERNRDKMEQFISYTDFKEAYNSDRKEILYNIVIKFGIHMKLIRLMKMCLTETCSRSQLENISLTCFLLKWSEQGYDLAPLLMLLRACTAAGLRVNMRKDNIKVDIKQMALMITRMQVTL